MVDDAAIRALEEQVAPWVELIGGGPPGWAPRMAAYLDLLREWNQRVNLVSRKSIERVVEDQLVPSLAALSVMPPGVAARALDIGSGGGFPGIPVAILRPMVRIDLVEAVRKKSEFLEAAARASGLRDAAVHWCRIEQPSESLLARGPFDIAFARAVGNPDLVTPAARRLLRGTGALWKFVRPGEPGSVPWPPQGEPRTALRRVPRAG